MKLKVVAFLMSLLSCLTLVVSCAPGASGPASTQDPGVVGGTGETVEELELPEDLYYDGDTFSVISAGNVAYDDFSYTEETAEGIVPEAQYRRLQTIKQNYGVDITIVTEVNKSSLGGGPGYQKVSKAVQSQTVDYHIGLIGGYDVASLARNNLLYDINSVEYISTQKSWWDQNANNDLSLNGLLLFTNGSLTAAYADTTFCMVFNKDLAKQYFKEGQDPYQYVKDNKWTIDKLAELSRLVSEDLDGDGEITYNDRFGLYTWDDSMIGMIEAAGSKICTVDENGVVSLTLMNDNTLNMFNKFSDIAFDKQYTLAYQRYSNKGLMKTYDSWSQNKALFWAVLTEVIPKLRDMETEFGILPYPLLSENQERYYTTIAPYNSQFICVPYYQEDTEFVGAISEALAYYGKEIVTPAVYEKALKGAYARDEESYEMLDIIFGSYGYDFGLYYQVGTYMSQLIYLLRNQNKAFASMYESFRVPAETELTALNANFDVLFSAWEK